MPVKVQSLLWRLANKTIGCNLRFAWKPDVSPYCSHSQCRNVIQNLEHKFYNCPLVVEFWNNTANLTLPPPLKSITVRNSRDIRKLVIHFKHNGMLWHNWGLWTLYIEYNSVFHDKRRWSIEKAVKSFEYNINTDLLRTRVAELSKSRKNLTYRNIFNSLLKENFTVS